MWMQREPKYKLRTVRPGVFVHVNFEVKKWTHYCARSQAAHGESESLNYPHNVYAPSVLYCFHLFLPPINLVSGKIKTDHVVSIQVISPAKKGSPTRSPNQLNVISAPLSSASQERIKHGKSDDLSTSKTLVLILEIVSFKAHIAPHETEFEGLKVVAESLNSNTNFEKAVDAKSIQDQY